MAQDHGWRGDGRFRVARLDGQMVLRFGGIWTKRTRLKADMGAFFRKDYRALRPRYGDFAVHIYVECERPRRRVDADNVAKACLDALTGILWRDDSQVQRLTVEKLAAPQDAVTLVVGEAGPSSASGELDALIAAADKLG
ncbi:MAG: RusA family crossover junction endodeoxyribonuclease [Rhodospirillaceae bacterium]